METENEFLIWLEQREKLQGKWILCKESVVSLINV